MARSWLAAIGAMAAFVIFLVLRISISLALKTERLSRVKNLVYPAFSSSTSPSRNNAKLDELSNIFKNLQIRSETEQNQLKGKRKELTQGEDNSTYVDLNGSWIRHEEKGEARMKDENVGDWMSDEKTRVDEEKMTSPRKFRKTVWFDFSWIINKTK
eukprot:TRINITY_DN36379_c0_g1_i1.p1 TRINITY_DN36379_c0_g1~~TRINITY_DN36379_c0_g1_i1.p1  ORF type:complete len:157 (-),score=16.26 TRINITY_DN36379_c0_g1_i1:157-627(-)